MTGLRLGLWLKHQCRDQAWSSQARRVQEQDDTGGNDTVAGQYRCRNATAEGERKREREGERKRAREGERKRAREGERKRARERGES
jgi:hypothetical protein